MEEKVKYSSYPEGYQKVLELLKDMPEEKREAYLQGLIGSLITRA